MGKFKPKRKFNPNAKKPNTQGSPDQDIEKDVLKATEKNPPAVVIDSVDVNRAAEVPMEFRAQVRGRCQRQKADLNDARDWISEWTSRIEDGDPFYDNGLAIIVPIQINWRVISNSGVDEGVVRPVIGSGGWPMLPGSSIKGLFRRFCRHACSPEKLLKWCGGKLANGEFQPGLLRFHGAWPTDSSWKKGLLDVAHPQQNWQLGYENGGEKHNANAIVSLYQPLLRVALSSSLPLSDAEWEEVKTILKGALSKGIGGRTCAGYGRISPETDEDTLYRCSLAGQGAASKLLSGTPEFRHNIFRASVRSMALRLFAGLCDVDSTNFVVNSLFGSLGGEGGAQIGLMATAFSPYSLKFGHYGRGQDTFSVTGELKWLQARKAAPGEDLDLLAELLEAIHGLVMVLGGFGRGWRRPDHSLFPLQYGQYFYNRNAIGCHWQWLYPDEIAKDIHIKTPNQIAVLLGKSRSLARRWLDSIQRKPGYLLPTWREILSPKHTYIWAREARNPDDAEVINWLHFNDAPAAIKGSGITGKLGSVGRIANRMYALNYGSPNANNLTTAMSKPLVKSANPLQKAIKSGGGIAQSTQAKIQEYKRQVYLDEFWENEYLEILTYFPNTQRRVGDDSFLQFLNQGGGRDVNFKRIEFK